MGRGHTPSLSRERPGQRFRGQPAESGEGTRWEGRHREKLQASGSGAPLRCSLRSEARSRPDPEEVAAARAVLGALARACSPLLSLYPLSEVSATPFSETRKRFQSCDIVSESAWPANGRRELLTGTPASASSDNFMPCDHFADEGPSWGASPLREHAVGKVRVGSVALPGSWISRVPGADTAAVGRGRGVCPRTRVPYTGGNCLQAIEKPLHLHGRSPGPRGVVGSGRAVGASILGGLWEPRTLRGAATSGQDDAVTTPGPGSPAVMERFSICVRRDQPHHRPWHRGDTSHPRPAPCDAALEVSRGQTGSLGWYPVLT